METMFLISPIPINEMTLGHTISFKVYPTLEQAEEETKRLLRCDYVYDNALYIYRFDKNFCERMNIDYHYTLGSIRDILEEDSNE